MSGEFDYRLPADLTITAVDDLLEELKLAVKSHEGNEFRVSADRVQNVDTSGIQVLLALNKSLDSRNKVLQLENVPDMLTRALVTSGADKII